MGKTQTTGQLAEQTALKYLLKNKLKLITQNWQCRFGEIDLIMLDQKQLVFIEVRFRKTSSYADAAESVHQFKQQKLIKTAEYFLSLEQKFNRLACRFDVIAIDDSAKIHWIKNAFQVQ